MTARFQTPHCRKGNAQMDRQQILLAKSLEAADLPLALTSFDDRLILQKAVYLLQSAGIQIGFRFHWYLRGPYSPDLTSAAFGILQEGHVGKTELQRWNLDEASADKARKISELFQPKDTKAAIARRLELLASLLFLSKTKQLNLTEAEKAVAILEQNDKFYSIKDVEQAVEDLRRYALVS